MSNDPYLGTAVRSIDPAQNRLNDAQIGIEDLDALHSMTSQLTVAGSVNPAVAGLVPEMMAESAAGPMRGLGVVAGEFSTMNSALDLQYERSVLEAQFSEMGNWQDRQALWDKLPIGLQQALIADGMERPEDPSPGGLQLIGTSILKRAGNLIPGVDLGPGNIEIGSTGNGVIDPLLSGANSVMSNLNPLEGLRKGAGGVFHVLDEASNQLIERPLRMGSLARDEQFGSESSGGLIGSTLKRGATTALGLDIPMTLKSLITGDKPEVDTPLGRLGLDAGMAFKSIFTGRAPELWQAAADRNATYRTGAIEQSLQDVGGDSLKHQMVLAAVDNNFNMVEATKDLTGAEQGTAEFNQMYVELVNATQDEGFGKAVQALTTGRVGFHHDMAEASGFQQGTAGEAWVSAGYQLGVLMVLDPTLAVGKLNRIRKIANVAVEGGQLAGELDRAYNLARVAREVDAGTEGVDVARAVMAANAATVQRMSDSRFARLLLSESKQLEYGRSVDRLVTQIADEAAREAPTFYELGQKVPSLKYMVQELSDAAVAGDLASPEHVWSWLRSNTGLAALNSGAVGRDARVVQIPRITAGTERWYRAKSFWRRSLDLNRTLPSDMRQAMAEANLAFQGDRITVGEYNRSVREFQDARSSLGGMTSNWFGLKPTLSRLVEHVPREGWISVQAGDQTPRGLKRSNDAINEFNRYLEFGNVIGLSDEAKEAYRYAFLTGNEGQRMKTIRTFTTELMAGSGMLDESEAAQEIMRKLGLALDQHFSEPSALPDLLNARASDISNRAAVWDVNTAGSVKIPRFQDVTAAVSKHQTLTSLSGQSYGRMEYLINKIWKPAVLMRAGTITRAAGEETVSFILRNGFIDYAKAQWGRRWIMAQTIDPTSGELRTIRELSPTFRRVSQMGQYLRSWSKTRPEDINQVLRIEGAASDLSELRRIEAQLTRTIQSEDNILRLSQRREEIIAPIRNRYLESLPRTHRLMHNLGEAAISSALRASPAYYDFLRAARIPSRQRIAETILGSRRVMRGAIPAYDESVPRLFGLTRRSSDVALGASPSIDNLILAASMAQDDPMLARIMHEGLTGGYSPYGTEEQIGNVAHQMWLSRERDLAKTTGWFGREHYVEMASPSREWALVDPLDDASRRAIGNAMLYPAEDPTIRHSGAFAALHNYVSTAALDELAKAFPGADPVSVLEDSRQLVRKWIQSGDLDAVSILRTELIDNADLSAIALAGFNDVSPRTRALLYPDAALLDEPLRFDMDELMTEVHQRIRNYAQRPDYQASRAALMRTADNAGTGLVAPLQPGYIRLHTVSIRPGDATRLEALAQDPDLMRGFLDEFKLAMRDKGITDVQISNYMDQLANGFDADGIRRLASSEDEFVAPMSWLFADPKLAEAVAVALDESLMMVPAMAGASTAYPMTERAVRTAYTDVSQAMYRNPRYLSPLNEEGLVVEAMNYEPFARLSQIDDANRVTFVELSDGRWIDEAEYQAMQDQPALTGRSYWASGMTEWAATEELVNKRAEELRRLFVTADDQVLSELTGHLYGRTFDSSFHMAIPKSEDLPTGVYAPVKVDVKSMRWDRIVNGYFKGILDPVMQGVIRTPHFMHNFASSLELADDFYQASTRGVLDDLIRETFTQQWGYSEDRLQALIDHVHTMWKHPDLVDDTSDWGHLLNLLADKDATPEEGFNALANALEGVNDQAELMRGALLDDLIEQHRVATGADPTAVQVSQYEAYASEVSGLSRSQIQDQQQDLLEELDSLTDPVARQEILDELATLDLVRDVSAPSVDGSRLYSHLESDEDITRLWSQLQNWSAARHYRYSEATQQAAIRAVEMTVEFVDDHRFRSQFQQTVRTLMPFMFAEEQFLKRQVRMLVDSPEAIRRASIMMNAGRTSGLIDTDAEGNEVFVYPMTKEISELVLRFAELTTGMDGLSVYAQPMTGHIEYMLPGYSGQYVEGGVGPFVGFSTAMLIDRFPELEPLDQIVNRSPVSQGRKPYEYFLPPAATNILSAVGINALGPDKFAAAQIRAIQIAAANGELPDETASPLELQQFQDQIRERARVLNVLDAMLYVGSPLPTGNRLNIDDAELSDDFTTMVLNGPLPYQENLALYFEKHPNATAYTIFGTKSTTGASPAINADLYQWIDDNKSLIESDPIVASYLMTPRSDAANEDVYSRRAADQLFQLGLREHRTPEDFLTEVYYVQDSRDYYDNVTQFQRQIFNLTQAGQVDQANDVQDQLDAFSEMFKNTHPIFASQQGRNAGRREETKIQRDRILQMNREDLPDGSHVDNMLVLMNAHSQFNIRMSALQGDRSKEAAKQREQLRVNMLRWGSDFAQLHPDVKQYFDTNIRWDSDITRGGPELIFQVEGLIGRELS